MDRGKISASGAYTWSTPANDHQDRPEDETKKHDLEDEPPDERHPHLVRDQCEVCILSFKKKAKQITHAKRSDDQAGVAEGRPRGEAVEHREDQHKRKDDQRQYDKKR